jgi:hypothetical protein
MPSKVVKKNSGLPCEAFKAKNTST